VETIEDANGKMGGFVADPRRRNAPGPPNMGRFWSPHLVLVSFAISGGSRLASLRFWALLATLSMRVSRLFRSFRVRGGFVCPMCWLARGVGIGVSALVVVLFARWFRSAKLLVRGWCWYWSIGAGFGRSVCAVVSFHLPLGSAPRVGRPSPNLAKKCEVRVVSLSCLNSAPRIPGGSVRPET